jgi:hypothetical protein
MALAGAVQGRVAPRQVGEPRLDLDADRGRARIPGEQRQRHHPGAAAQVGDAAPRLAGGEIGEQQRIGGDPRPAPGLKETQPPAQQLVERLVGTCLDAGYHALSRSSSGLIGLMTRPLAILG